MRDGYRDRDEGCRRERERTWGSLGQSLMSYCRAGWGLTVILAVGNYIYKREKAEE